MLGFKGFTHATVTIRGIELVHQMKKTNLICRLYALPTPALHK